MDDVNDEYVQKKAYDKARVMKAVNTLGRRRFTVYELWKISGDEWFKDKGSGKRISILLREIGYEILRNPNDKTGRWLIDGKQTNVWFRPGV